MFSIDAVAYLIGSGSMSIGVEQAGYTIRKIYETPGYSKNAKTWDINKPDLKHEVLEMDSAERIPDAQGVDLIYGNPPCGGMSNITGAHSSSPTNEIMIKWLKVCVNTRPRMILMENAYQIATKNGEPILRRLMSIAESAGYHAWVWEFFSWQLGCPQRRRRAFFCATLDKPNPNKISLEDLPQTCPGDLSVMDWLWDLEKVTPSPNPVYSMLGHEVTMHWWDNTGVKVSELLPEHFDIATKLFVVKRQYEKLMNSSKSSDKSKLKRVIADGLYWENAPQIFDSMMEFRKPKLIPLFGPINTVVSDFVLVHPTVKRLLTMRENARLMGYPDHWKFHNCKANLVAQGVPAINAKWAAKRIRETVGLYSPLPL